MADLIEAARLRTSSPRAVVISVGLGFTEQRKERIVHDDNADLQGMLDALFRSRRRNLG